MQECINCWLSFDMRIMLLCPIVWGMCKVMAWCNCKSCRKFWLLVNPQNPLYYCHDWIICHSAMICVLSCYYYTRPFMGSTHQADPSCFYFRISWILAELWYFVLFLSPRFSAGPQIYKHKVSHKYFTAEAWKKIWPLFNH